MRKIKIFDKNRLLSRRLYEIEPWLLWKVISGGSNRVSSMTLSDLERRDARGQILKAYLLNNSHTNQIRQDNSVREGGVYSWAAQPGCVGCQCPPTFGTSGVQGGTQGRSNENDFCFYNRQSLFSN